MGGVPTESGGPSVQLYLLILLRLKDRDCQKKKAISLVNFFHHPKSLALAQFERFRVRGGFGGIAVPSGAFTGVGRCCGWSD